VAKKISLGIPVLLFVAFLITYGFYSSYRSERLDTLKANSKVVETSAGRIEYRLVGDSGPVVLFLHGTPGGYDQTTALPGFRVLTPSRPGYLRTPLEVGSTPAQQSYANAALLDVLGIDSVVVMGASGGGPSAISFAATYPERTLALIAMEAVSQSTAMDEDQQSPPFFMRSDFLLWASLSLMDNLMGPEGIIALLVPDPTIQQLILQDPVKTADVEALLWSVWPVSQRAAGQHNDIMQFGMLNLPSEKITAPTLIVHGTKDINVPFGQSEKLAAQIPAAILHAVEGGDHMMPFSHSEEVERVVEQFLLKLNLD